VNAISTTLGDIRRRHDEILATPNEVPKIAPPESAGYRFAAVCLTGLWYSRIGASGIIMEQDPEWWEVVKVSDP
jgi:hypothetical protein